MKSLENGISNMPMNSIGIEMKNSFQGIPSNSECKPSIFINGFSINSTFIKDSSNSLLVCVRVYLGTLFRDFACKSLSALRNHP